MNWLRTRAHSSWDFSIVSGLLILLSSTIQHLAGGMWNVVLTEQWWIDAGEHAHEVSHGFTLANLFMLAAAVVAGYGIVVKAIRA